MFEACCVVSLKCVASGHPTDQGNCHAGRQAAVALCTYARLQTTHAATHSSVSTVRLPNALALAFLIAPKTLLTIFAICQAVWERAIGGVGFARGDTTLAGVVRRTFCIASRHLWVCVTPPPPPPPPPLSVTGVRPQPPRLRVGRTHRRLEQTAAIAFVIAHYVFKVLCGLTCILARGIVGDVCNAAFTMGAAFSRRTAVPQ